MATTVTQPKRAPSDTIIVTQALWLFKTHICVAIIYYIGSTKWAMYAWKKCLTRSYKLQTDTNRGDWPRNPFNTNIIVTNYEKAPQPDECRRGSRTRSVKVWIIGSERRDDPARLPGRRGCALPPAHTRTPLGNRKLVCFFSGRIQ